MPMPTYDKKKISDTPPTDHKNNFNNNNNNMK